MKSKESKVIRYIDKCNLVTNLLREFCVKYNETLHEACNTYNLANLYHMEKRLYELMRDMKENGIELDIESRTSAKDAVEEHDGKEYMVCHGLVGHSYIRCMYARFPFISERRNVLSRHAEYDTEYDARAFREINKSYARGCMDPCIKSVDTLIGKMSYYFS